MRPREGALRRCENFWLRSPLRPACIVCVSLSAFIIRSVNKHLASSQCVNVMPADEARMRALTVNRVQLLDLIDSNDAFVTELASPDVGCITWSQRDHIVNIVQPRDRNEKLLEFITRRSVADFNKFINVLSKQQAHLLPLFITDGGKTYISFCKLAFSQQSLCKCYAYPV